MGRGPVGAPAIIRYVNNSVSEVDSVSASAGLTDDMVLIKTLTASSSATLDFVDGTSDVVLDSTYPIYVFKFIYMHPSSDANKFGFQGSTNTGSSYGITATTTSFYAGHLENNADTEFSYSASYDLAQSTDFSFHAGYDLIGSDNDQALSGELWLFNPSSTTYVKHWIYQTNHSSNDNGSANIFGGGYFNTTSAIDAIQFKMADNNMDAGTIKLYGIKDS